MNKLLHISAHTRRSPARNRDVVRDKCIVMARELQEARDARDAARLAELGAELSLLVEQEHSGVVAL